MDTTTKSDDEADLSPKKVTKSNYRSILDSDSEEDEKQQEKSPEKEEEIAEESFTKSRIIAQSSDSSDSENEEAKTTPEKPHDRRKNKNPKKKILPAKTQRKSATKAMEVIQEKMNHKKQAELKQEIQSEKQRMDREQEVRVPYHKPKQYSLKEFLARRTINKPSIENIKEGKQPVNSIIALKMNGEQLEKFAQKMKEREEEALEFFRSESESDNEEESLNKENVSENLVAQETKEVPVEDQVEDCEMKVEVTLEVARDEMETNEKEVLEMTEEKEVLDSLPVEVTEEAAEAAKDDKMSEDPELDRLRDKYKDTPLDLQEIDDKPAISAPTLKTLNEMNSKDFVIDLETGSIEPRQLSGPEMLFQKYLKTVQKPKHKETICMNILTVENGRLENQKVEVKLDKEIEMDHQRPGFSHEKLKENLRNQIVHKRLEELKKKVKKVELEPEDKENQDEVDGDAGEDSDADFEGDCEEESCEEDEEELEACENEKKLKVCELLDDEAINEDESEEESEDESSSSEEEAVAPKKGRILKAFEDSDDESSKKDQKIVEFSEPLCVTQNLVNPPAVEATQDDLFSSPTVSDARTFDDIFSTQPSTFDEPSISEEPKDNGIEGLCDPNPSQMVDDDDLMEICSGRFAPTQVGVTQKATEVEAADDGFNDSQFVSQVPETETVVENARKMLESTDDEADELQVKEKRRKKKKRKQKVKKLEFSDDEDEASNQADNETELTGSEEEEQHQEEEVLVDYDSEENEIEVKMNKKDRINAAGDYFENEAELSESEWGSADEDEKNLDKFDIELGDEDQFDQNKLQEEVGRIHARKILDDDIRNVKKIQELLFEDEENDGVGRDRKFRWKNQTEGFTLEDENARDGDALEAGEAEDESEINWRKMRHERETMLSEQSQKMTESDTMSEEILLLDHNSQTVTSSSTSLLVKRKFLIIKSTSSMGNSPVSTPEAGKKDSPFLIKTSSLKKFQSSSFLSRDEQTLTKIARFVSHKDDEVSNTMSSHGGNSMSFATIDKPDDSKKRKSDGNQKAESSKKRKLETQTKPFLLDQLK